VDLARRYPNKLQDLDEEAIQERSAVKWKGGVEDAEIR